MIIGIALTTKAKLLKYKYTNHPKETRDDLFIKEWNTIFQELLMR